MKRSRVLGTAAAVATLAAAGALAAAERTAGAWIAPLSEHRTTTTAGYRFTVHPAFSSRAVLRGADGGETELHRQTAVHHLPAGRTAGPDQHTIRLEGGALARDLGITVSDPKHQVARITVELYGAGHVPGRASPIVETLVVGNNGGTCPPDCDEGPTGLPPTGLPPR